MYKHSIRNLSISHFILLKIKENTYFWMILPLLASALPHLLGVVVPKIHSSFLQTFICIMS